ncbi:MAG: tryptophan synthase subunit alpha [Candidatus Dormibacteria bacterium]
MSVAGELDRGAGRLTAALSTPRRDGLPAIIPYLTAGFPALGDTAALLAAAEAAGAAAVEVGLPFSDPLADGPTIQASSQRALENGMSVALALEQIAAARSAGLHLPVVVMTYINPVLAHGVQRFCDAATNAGVDGLIIPDLPWGEGAELRAMAASAGIAAIPLVTPLTAPRRLDEACSGARGFVYCVAVAGVTGARRELPAEALDLLERVRSRTPTPRALGFGVSQPEHLTALRGRAEAVVVGSALLDEVGRELGSPAETVGRFLRRLAGGG